VKKGSNTVLTKPTLRFTKKNGELQPGFLDTKNKTHAAHLLSFSQISKHVSDRTKSMNLEDFEELCGAPTQGSATSHKICLGLQKVLSDTFEFARKHEDSASDMRHAVFKSTFRLLKEHKLTARKLSLNKEHFSQEYSKPYQDISDGLYSDLPHLQSISSATAFEPEELANSYNKALFFGLMIHVVHAQITVVGISKLQLQELISLLRKHNVLLKSITDVELEKTILTLEGPVNVLIESQKYGLLFARFVKDICFYNNINLSATLEIHRGEKLTYSQSFCSLPFARFKEFDSFQVSELNLLLDHLNAVQTKFEFKTCSTVLPGMLNPLCIPDFSVVFNSDVHYFELFSPWQQSILEKRIEQISGSFSQIKITICVPKKMLEALPKNEASKLDVLQRSGKILIISKFPTSSAILKLLNQAP
jgi:predicted nuclease of restriction endonuclease-like RecB superfamily